MRVIVTGGGTGGHLYPGLAVVEELGKKVSCQILFIGTRSGVEAKVVPQKGYVFQTIWISGFKRGRIWTNIFFPLKVVVSLVQALSIVYQFNAQVVLGTGGYVSWPVVMAAVLLGKKTVIQEQNQSPGIVTRVLAPFVSSVHLSYEASRNYFRSSSRVHVTGNPTQSTLDGFSRAQGCRRFGLASNKKTLFVFGGSQGSLAINRAVLDLLPSLLKEKDIQILWATGPRWFKEIEKKTTSNRNTIKIFPYIHDMGMAYAASDLVLCRSGATTVAEVARLGIPAIFIPFADAAEGHQMENARALWQAGAAEMVLENQIHEGRLESLVLSVLHDSQQRKAMGEKAKRFGRPQAASIIADDMIAHVSHECEEVSPSEQNC